MKYRICMILAILACWPPYSAQGQLGKVVREGLEAAGKGGMKSAAREAVQETTELTARKAAQSAMREIGQESAESLAGRTATVAGDVTQDAIQAVSRHGSVIATPVLREFGDEGARALVRLSPGNARRMAMMTDELAASGKGSDLMGVVAQKGDAAAEWLWKHKEKVAAGTVAVAFLANPDSFLQAGQEVAVTAIETTGKEVARPLIEETVRHVSPKVIEVVARTVIPQAVQAVVSTCANYPWVILTMLSGLGLCGFVAYRWYLHPLVLIFRQWPSVS